MEHQKGNSIVQGREHTMKHSRVVYKNGNPILEIGGEEVAPLAYMTYFEERNDYKNFAKAGVRLYTLSISLGDLPINSKTGSKPQTYGVFAKKGQSDFTGVDKSLRQILDACPDAYIFPRVYVCMPQWWIDENPTETVPITDSCQREALYSQKYREDGAAMLTQFIEYIQSSEFADHVIGYHIAGGQTEEWFHLDGNGSYCENALPYFNRYLIEKGKSPVSELPDVLSWTDETVIDDAMKIEYMRFASDSVADTISYLCRAAKSAVRESQVVGVFYGYCWGVPHQLWGSQSLYKLLDCPDIDFFCSPLSYWENRPLGRDWPEQFPTASVKLHGKMCFIECDIRTHLTVYPGQARKGFDEKGLYNVPVFLGPPTEEGAVAAMRKSLAGQITRKQGMWWFDMFGGWYDDLALMAEIGLSRNVYDAWGKDAYDFPVQIALFIDEKLFSRLGLKHPYRRFACDMHEAIGRIGAPIHYYLVSDCEKIDWASGQYKAALFMAPEMSEDIAKAMVVTKECGIASLAVREPLTAGQFRDFLAKSGAHILCESDDVVYFGNGYLGLHAATAGEKNIHLPIRLRCTDLTNGLMQETNCLIGDYKEFETKLFSVEEI